MANIYINDTKRALETVEGYIDDVCGVVNPDFVDSLSCLVSEVKELIEQFEVSLDKADDLEIEVQELSEKVQELESEE